MKNLEPIEKKITELERKTTPPRIWVRRDDEDFITCDGEHYSQAEFEAMVTDADTVVSFVHFADDEDDQEEE